MRPNRLVDPEPQPEPQLKELIQELMERIDGLTARLDRTARSADPRPKGGEYEAVPLEYLTVKQAARFTALSESSIRRAIGSGSLPASNLGSASQPTWRIARVDLETWMNSKKGGDSKVPPNSELKDLIRRHLSGL